MALLQQSLMVALRIDALAASACCWQVKRVASQSLLKMVVLETLRHLAHWCHCINSRLERLVRKKCRAPIALPKTFMADSLSEPREEMNMGMLLSGKD